MNWDCCSYCDLESYPGNTYTRDGWDYPHGDEDDVAEPITDRLAVLPDGGLLRLTPPDQPTVDEMLKPGTLIRANYHHEDRVYKVFRVREREYYGVPAYTIAIGDPDTPAKENGLPKNYQGANIKELVYQDGAIRKLFWNNDDELEILGRDAVDVDYQASFATFATDGGTLEDFGADVPDPEEQPADAEPDTTDDYKYSRPQCRALTNDGERCSNPVRRTDGTARFCPRHHDTDCDTIDDRLETDGGTRADNRPPWLPMGGEKQYRCRNCGTQVTQQFARVFGDNRDIVHGCPDCTTYRSMNTEAPDAGGDADAE